MKLLRLSFALILTTLVLVLKCEKRKINEPSGERTRDENNSCACNEQGQPINKRTYSVSIQPNEADQDRYKDEKKYWKRQIRVSKYLNWITLITAAVGVSGLLYLKWTLDQSREFFDATQRAIVTLGNKDGRLAEFRLVQKPIVVVHFYNAGPTPAVDVAVGMSSSLGPSNVTEPQLNRYWTSYGRIKLTGQPTSVIPGQSGHIEYLSDNLIPSKEQLTEIRNGKRFSIFGIYIYCDRFGLYSGEDFNINYVPSVDDFVTGLNYTFPVKQMSKPANQTTMKGHVPMLRCKQPGEDDEMKKKEQNTGLRSPP